MARSDSDTWDLASSVGATATMVAAARALATADADPIISDPFAAPLVRAVGIDFFIRVIDGEIRPADTAEATPSDTTAPSSDTFADAALPALAAKAIQDGCHQLNPRPCTVEDLLDLYRAAL